jgi:hypothetical protein
MAYTTIDNPELYFQTKTYSGSSSDVTVTFDGSEDMQPDVVWLKKRNGSGDHLIYDSVRGTNKRLQPNSTDVEVDRSSNNDELKSFNSDGWTLGSFNSNVTGAGSTNVSWNWKKSATAGFDIVTYTGTGSARTVSHSLSAVPNWMILKDRDASKSWVVYHSANTSAPETEYLLLDGTGATSDFAGYFNDTAPTSSVFTVGTGSDANASSDDFIAYLWSEKQGYSKFGSYTGNGSSTDGTFIYLGFRPAMFLIKSSSNAEQWEIMDNKRDTTNIVNQILVPNGSDAEIASVAGNRFFGDFLSNGVKLRGNASSANGSGITYIYAAFAESPFVNSNGVPNNAR